MVGGGRGVVGRGGAGRGGAGWGGALQDRMVSRGVGWG